MIFQEEQERVYDRQACLNPRQNLTLRDFSLELHLFCPAQLEKEIKFLEHTLW